MKKKTSSLKDVTDPALLAKLNAYEAQKKEPSESQTILNDIINSAENAPVAILNAAANLPGQLIEGGSELYHHPLRGTGQLAVGALREWKDSLIRPRILHPI